MKRKIIKTLAAAGSFVVLANCQATLRSYASEMADGAEYTVSNARECRRLLMEAVSSVYGRERNEFFVTGEDYEPDTLIIAQMFPETINISNTKILEYEENGKKYVTCRIGFERRPGGDTCSHQWKTESLEEESCLWGRKEKLICELCGKEQIISAAPPGHVDKNGDTFCDRCKDRIEGEQEAERKYWTVGEIQSREIGGKTYKFRCVDEDYSTNHSDNQKYALFLCEAVIRSDIDSTDSKRKIITFGKTSNYKTSDARKWLLESGKASEKDLAFINTGVNSAFSGKTEEGAFMEFSDAELSKMDLPVQVVMDQWFLLSLEEALEYRDILWEVSGKESPYSQGYWLRTPVFMEESSNKFAYGEWEYAVDLIRGCIRPAQVFDGAMGFRPAYCLPQM